MSLSTYFLSISLSNLSLVLISASSSQFFFPLKYSIIRFKLISVDLISSGINTLLALILSISTPITKYDKGNLFLESKISYLISFFPLSFFVMIDETPLINVSISFSSCKYLISLPSNVFFNSKYA